MHINIQPNDEYCHPCFPYDDPRRFHRHILIDFVVLPRTNFIENKQLN